MTITIEQTQCVKTEIEVPEYFTSLTGWFHKVLPDGQVFQVADSGIGIYGFNSLSHLHSFIKPCTQDDFVKAYCRVINTISAASGIEHLPLNITYDNTSNPES